MKLLFEPEKWHACSARDWQACAENANCYAYALNRPDYYWAVPGHDFVKTETQRFYDSFNAHFKGLTLAEFRERLTMGAVRDGLIQIAEPEEREGYYLTALFFSDDPSNFDFHWYRQDDNGTWSHKDGWHVPSNTDGQGNVIRDPRDRPSPDYPLFGGFFLVLRKGVGLGPVFPL